MAHGLGWEMLWTKLGDVKSAVEHLRRPSTSRTSRCLCMGMYDATLDCGVNTVICEMKNPQAIHENCLPLTVVVSGFSPSLVVFTLSASSLSSGSLRNSCLLCQ